MRASRRVRVHRVTDMPGDVQFWVEPSSSHGTDIYIRQQLITSQEAALLEQRLNTPSREA